MLVNLLVYTGRSMAVSHARSLLRRRSSLIGLSLAAIAVGVAFAVGAMAAGSSRYIVFTGAPTGGGQTVTPQLYRIRASGGGLRQITTGAKAALDPSFSPLGRRIAFARLGVGIFTMNPDGSGLRRLTTNGRDSYPTWAPTGGQIAFVRPVGSEWRLFVVSTSGGAPRLLGKAPPAGRPSWTKAGLLLPSGGDLLRIDPETGAVSKYYGANIDAIWGLSTVSLSTDSTRLTYMGAREPDPGDKECGEGPCQRFALYLENLTTEKKKPHLLVKDVGPASFSPDGRKLAYAAGGRLFLRSVATGATHGLAIGTVAAATSAPPAWQPR
jgi:Tol biopolymer transport system component